MYLRQNAAQEFIGDIREISQPTVSRYVRDLIPAVKTVLKEFVPSAAEAIELVNGRVCLVDGTITPCWSYQGHDELWSRKKGTTGFSARRQAELDEMLAVDPVLGRTRLSWLGTGPVAATPAAVKGELEKLAYLRGLDADTLDLSVLPAERRRFLAGVGRRLTPQHLARREPARRYPILLTLISQSAVDVLDESLLLFDQALSGRESAARARLTEALAGRARGGENRQALLDDILKIVLDPGVADEQIGVRLRGEIGLERMRAAWEARRERLPRDHGHLAMMDASMAYLRQFVPDVLAAVRFAGGPGMDDLLHAVTILAGLYATRARKVPDDAPGGFVPARWAGRPDRPSAAPSAGCGTPRGTAPGPRRSGARAARDRQPGTRRVSPPRPPRRPGTRNACGSPRDAARSSALTSRRRPRLLGRPSPPGPRTPPHPDAARPGFAGTARNGRRTSAATRT